MKFMKNKKASNANTEAEAKEKSSTRLEWLKKQKKAEKRPPIKIRLKTIVIALLVVGLLRIAHCYVNRDFLEAVNKLKTIDNLINEKYIYKIPDKNKLYSNACKAFVNSLPDPYSAFWSQKEFISTGIPLGKKLFGVGCSIRLVEFDDFSGEYEALITNIQKDSPMDKAGFLPGDYIMSVNNLISSAYYNSENESHANLSPVTPDAEHIDLLLAGLGDCVSAEEKCERIIPYHSNIDSISNLSDNISPNQKAVAQNANVALCVLRLNPQNNEWEEYSSNIKKRFLPVCNVSYKLINLNQEKVGYIRLKSFDLNVGNGFKIALNKLLDQKVSGIVLDLRGNLGGNIKEFEEIVTQLLNKGILYSIRGKDKSSNKTISATGKNFNPKTSEIGFSVLVNNLSASCSEMLAACLQSHGRCKIIGEPTFGKGVCLYCAPVGGGDYLAISDAVWFAEPGRKSVEDISIDTTVKTLGLTSDNFGKYSKDNALVVAAKQALEDSKKLKQSKKAGAQTKQQLGQASPLSTRTYKKEDIA